MNNKIYRYLCIFAILSMFFAASCQRHEPENMRWALAFSAEAEDILYAKSGAGVEKTTDANLAQSPFGVYGVYTQTADDEDGTNVFLSSAAMKVTHDGSAWVYSPVAYWNINQYYRFRAFHPYSGNAFVVNSSSNADKLMIEYKIASGTEDILVGFKSLEANISNIQQKVPIIFRHALCALRFVIAFKNSPDIADDYTDQITSFYLSGIIPSGTLVYGHKEDDIMTEDLRWIATYYDTSEYYEWTGSKTFRKYNGTNGTLIMDGSDGMVFAIPQTCSEPSKPTSIHFKTEKGGNADHSAVLPSSKWEPGKIYTYTLLIEKSDIQLSVSIKDWNEVQSNENIYL